MVLQPAVDSARERQRVRAKVIGQERPNVLARGPIVNQADAGNRAAIDRGREAIAAGHQSLRMLGQRLPAQPWREQRHPHGVQIVGMEQANFHISRPAARR